MSLHNCMKILQNSLRGYTIIHSYSHLKSCFQGAPELHLPAQGIKNELKQISWPKLWFPESKLALENSEHIKFKKEVPDYSRNYKPLIKI